MLDGREVSEARTHTHTHTHAHRPTVLRKMKSLTVLDGRDVSEADRAMFGDNAGALTMAMVLEHGSAKSRGLAGGRP